jgi:hypothetical protein
MDLLFIPHIIYEHREPWWNDIGRTKLLIRQQGLSGNPNSHLVAKQEEMGEGSYAFGLSKYLCSYFE